MIYALERRVRLRWIYASLTENRDRLSINPVTRMAARMVAQDGRITTRIELAPALNSYPGAPDQNGNVTRW